MVFPELGLSGYSIEDLLHQHALLDGGARALDGDRAASAALLPVIVVGAPLAPSGGLFNTAVVIHRGRMLGVVPKSYLPEYREYYEKRQFRAARDLVGDELDLVGKRVPFGADLISLPRDLPDFAVHVEICEDLWAPIPPSTYGALAGATVLANLSASNTTVGKADYRHGCARPSRPARSPPTCTPRPGSGESTTDLAWDGQAMIYENGDRLAEAERFADEEQLIFADVDLDRIVSDRAAHQQLRRLDPRSPAASGRMRRIEFELGVPTGKLAAAATSRALPVRPRRPGEPQRALPGGLQHPGPGAGDAAAGHRDREARDRRLGRAWTRPTR